MEIGGRELSWTSIGAGPPLLLINGYAATAADWDPGFLAGLGRAFRVICPDNRGFGGSGLGDPADLTIDSMAADCEALLDSLGVDRLAVAGWSMGGFVAQGLATRIPDRVEALILLSTDPGGDAAIPAEPATWDALTDSSGTPREQASRLLSLLFPPSLAPVIDREFGDLVATARAGLSPAALRAQEAAIDAWNANPQPAPTAQIPVLAISGSEDMVIPPQNLEALAAKWPGARQETFDGGGHAFMAQFPERLAATLTEFIQVAGGDPATR